MKKNLFGILAACSMLCTCAFSVSADETTAPAETTAAVTTSSASVTSAAQTALSFRAPVTGDSKENRKQVNITISSEGELKVVNKTVDVQDVDGDGALTIADTLALAHYNYYDGGYDGFSAENTATSLFITKLWGVVNGGSYFYYHNNEMAMSLTTPVNDGDYICAFSYKDATGYSDQYTFFDKNEDSIKAGGTVTLTLKGISFDENWQAVASPLKGAVLTVDGKKTDAVTDENGSASLTVSDAGEHVISAEVDGKIIVPPAAVLTVDAVGTDTIASGTDAKTTGTTAATTASSAKTSTQKAANNNASAAKTTAKPAGTGTNDAPKAGDKSVTAVAVTGLTALAAAVILRKRRNA